jgi:hypothetical protein
MGPLAQFFSFMIFFLRMLKLSVGFIRREEKNNLVRSHNNSSGGAGGRDDFVFAALHCCRRTNAFLITSHITLVTVVQHYTAPSYSLLAGLESVISWVLMVPKVLSNSMGDH